METSENAQLNLKIACNTKSLNRGTAFFEMADHEHAPQHGDQQPLTGYNDKLFQKHPRRHFPRIDDLKNSDLSRSTANVDQKQVPLEEDRHNESEEDFSPRDEVIRRHIELISFIIPCAELPIFSTSSDSV